jgi:hypothetical protein
MPPLALFAFYDEASGPRAAAKISETTTRRPGRLHAVLRFCSLTLSSRR